MALTRTRHFNGNIKKDLKLDIEDFGANAELNEGVRSYYKLLKDYMMKMGHTGVVHTHNNYVPFRGNHGKNTKSV